MILDKEKMNELKQIELEIFKSFIRVCEKLNVKYYLLGGTLLGAVRHKGFIPWDDDIDVGMFREDYEKFVSEAQQYLPSNLFVQTYLTDEEYPQVFAKIRNTNTAFIETSVASLKMNHGIFMDIFPLDGYSKKADSWIRQTKIKLIGYRISCGWNIDNISLKAKVLRIVSKIVYPDLKKAKKSKDQIYKSIQKTDKIANYSGMWGRKEIVPSEWYGEGTELIFEGLKVNAPTEYDKWLTQVYGDYMTMPPVEKRVTHHLTTAIDFEKSYLEYMN